MCIFSFAVGLPGFVLGQPTNCAAGSYHAHTRTDYGEYSCGSTGDAVDNPDWCEWLGNEMIRSVPDGVFGRPDPYESSTGYGFWGGSGQWPNDPPGCFVDPYGGMYWNSHPSGTTASIYAPICYNGCVACPAGWVPSSGLSAYCESVDCAAGQYPQDGGCSDCAEGTYSNDGTSCSDCHVGMYSGNAASYCLNCPTGKYQPSS
eukprot:COSAG02_NODE_17268_length_1017_cov_0.959695_1_plen_202_part_10